MDVISSTVTTILAVVLAGLIAAGSVAGTIIGKKLLGKLDTQKDTLSEQKETLGRVEILVNHRMDEAQAEIKKLQDELNIIRNTEIAALKIEIQSIKDREILANAAAMAASKESEILTIKNELSSLRLILQALQTVPALPVHPTEST